MTEANAKILLVVDDDSLRRVLEFLLSEEAGHSMVSESDGREALRSYSAEDFDCVITDWRMPKIRPDVMKLIPSESSVRNTLRF